MALFVIVYFYSPAKLVTQPVHVYISKDIIEQTAHPDDQDFQRLSNHIATLQDGNEKTNLEDKLARCKARPEDCTFVLSDSGLISSSDVSFPSVSFSNNTPKSLNVAEISDQTQPSNTTYGENSPVVSGTNGDVSIEINNSDQ